MISIPLRKLNSDYPALLALSAQQPNLPKESTADQRIQAGKIVYKIGRIADAAKAQQEVVQKSLEKLAKLFDITLGDLNNPKERVTAFNESADEMLRANKFSCRWDAFKLEELAPYFDLTGDICQLGWLITGDEKEEAYMPTELIMPAIALPPSESSPGEPLPDESDSNALAANA